MSKKLLLVDDDQSILSILRYALDNKGYQIIEATNGYTAKQLIYEEKPDIIIMDVLMPKIDGFTLLKEIRSKNEFKNVPIIITSAVYKSFSIVQNAMKNLGATDYYTKPFDLKRLVEKALSLCPTETIPEGLQEPKKISKYLLAEKIPENSEFKIVPISKVLANFFIAKKNGALTVSNNAIAKKIILKSGIPVEVYSNVAGEWLGRLLVRDNVITPTQYEETITIVHSSNRKHGEVLIEKGIITPHELYSYLKKQVTEKIVNTFAWKEGAYDFSTDMPYTNLVPKEIEVSKLLWEGIKRKVDINFIKEELSEIKGESVFKLKDKNTLQENFNFVNGTMLKLLSSFDGGKRLSVIANDLGEASDDFYVLFYILLLLDSLALVDEKTGASKELIRASKYSAKENAPLTEEENALLKKVSELYNNLSKLNYYNLLELPINADKSAIKKSYFRMAKEFHPDRFNTEQFEQIRGRANKIFTEISNAYQTLSDDTLRGKYDQDISNSKNNDQLSKGNEIVEAEIQFQKGNIYLRNKDFPKAYEAFQWALKLNPREAEYHLSYAITVFKDPQINPLEARLKAKEILERVVSMNDNLDKAYYYLGLIYKLNDNINTAARYFKKAVEINPNNIEAASELRLIKSRAEKNSKKDGFFNKIFK